MNTPNMSDLAVSHPIEGILQNLSAAVWSRVKGEPTREALPVFQGLLEAAERGLKAIVEVDSRVRPTEDWMEALNIVEAIRDEALETIEMLESL